MKNLTIENIFESIKNLLIGGIGEHPLKGKILNELGILSNDVGGVGQRFLVCLAIDLETGNLSQADILDVLFQIDYDIKDETFLSKFDRKIASDLGRFLRQAPMYPLKDFPQLATVIRWSKIFDKLKIYKSKEMGAPLVDIDDESFLSETTLKEQTTDLKHIKEWCGWKGLTWLVPLAELQEFLKAHNPVENVLDRLGLDSLSKNQVDGSYDHLIYIHYEEDSMNKQCFQPTLMSGYWLDTDGMYLSYFREDGYGRTFATSGKYPLSAKELVTSSLDYGSEFCKPFYIGQQKDELRKDTSMIVEEGLRRYNIK